MAAREQKRVNLFLIAKVFLGTVVVTSLGLNLFFWQKFRAQNLVVQVADGDTFQLKSGKRIRLLGVDAPEYDLCAGPEAKKRLQELIEGKIVTLKEETKETYGRFLALVYVNGTLVNKVMLEEGWARIDYRKSSEREVLTQAFHQGQKTNQGIWDLCRITETPTGCNIKGNIDKRTWKKTYHLLNCHQYDQVIIEKDIGERFFCTEQEAQAAGFNKAPGCPK